MALTQPLSIAGALDLIQQALDDLCQPVAGVAAVVPSISEFWKQAYASSQKPTVLICYNGERVRGDFSVSNSLCRVDRDWIVAVKRGRGYFQNRGDSLYKNANVAAFFAFVEQIRDGIRSILNISEEQPLIDYKGIKPMKMGNIIMDAYTIEFSTANDLPMIYPFVQNAGGQN